jgi:hypothetical protein
MWLAFALVLPAQQCFPLADAEEAMIAPAPDVHAHTSLDALDGPAPTNLVVFRDGRAGFVSAQVEDLDDETDAPRAISPEVTSLAHRYVVGPLTAGTRARFTLLAAAPEVDPQAERRDLDFAVGDAADLQAPTLDEEAHALQEKNDGGWRQGCGPIPFWQDDEYITTVSIPAASDDVGVAAFELRLTSDGFEGVTDVAIVGDGRLELVAITYGAPPEALRIVAIDHAGNMSAPQEVSHVHEQGGCAQTGGSSGVLALVLVLLGLRSRRSVRRGL